MKEGMLLFCIGLVACGTPFSSGSDQPTGGAGGSTTSSTTSSSTSPSGGSGGSAGTTSSSGGASGGLVGGGGSGGAGGSVPTVGLTFSYPGHAPTERLGISGIKDRPNGPDLVSNGMLPLPGCIASLLTDESVSCDIGPAEAGTILRLDPAGYQGDGTFLFFHCDPSNLPGALCVGSITVTIGGVFYASCEDVPQSPCSYGINADSNRLRFVVHLP